MVKIFIIFLITIIILGMLVGVAVAIQGKDRLKNPDKGLDNTNGEETNSDSNNSEEDPEAGFYDEEGNHIYYERSLIKKRRYAKEHPDEVEELRTFHRLFSKKKN